MLLRLPEEVLNGFVANIPLIHVCRVAIATVLVWSDGVTESIEGYDATLHAQHGVPANTRHLTLANIIMWLEARSESISRTEPLVSRQSLKQLSTRERFLLAMPRAQFRLQWQQAHRLKRRHLLTLLQ